MSKKKKNTCLRIIIFEPNKRYLKVLMSSVVSFWRNAVSKNGLLYEDLGITYCHMNGQTKSGLDHIQLKRSHQNF